MTSSMKHLIALAAFSCGVFAHAQGANSNIDLVATADVQPADPATTKKNELQLKALLLGEGLQDPHEDTKWAGTELDIIGHHRFNDWFQARIDLSVFVTTGSYTNQYTDAGKAPNAIAINEAVIQADPNKYSTFEAGVIQTNFLDLPSTFEANGFPSLKASVHFENPSMKVSMFGMESIPTSDTKTVQATDDSGMTTLATVGASVASNPKETEKLTLSAGIVHFAFRNLNSSAATDSEYLGNSVDSPGPQAHFIYGFGGNEYAASGKYKFSHGITGSMNGAFLKNDLAPDGRNKGYTYSTGATMMMFGCEMGATVGRFYNESDTLPGSYSTLSRGFNDRFGNRFVLTVEDKKEKVIGKLAYTEADAISETNVIADRTVLMMSLEVAYDIL